MATSSAKSAGREARLARALRANLKRRKAHARAKQGQAGADGEAEAAGGADETAVGPGSRPNMAQKGR
jgi:hypothetical protein